jgi:hypothetical protein
MKWFHGWLKNTSTHKIVTTLVYLGCAAFIIVVMIGWFRGLENAVGMMNCAAMVVVANSVQYAGKAGFEHSKWATPLVAGIASGLSSGDPAAGVQNAISAYESEKQMQAMTEQAQPATYADPSSAPSAEDMPAEGVNHNMAG